MRIEIKKPAKFWRAFFVPSHDLYDSIMQLKKLFISQDYGVYSTENHEVRQALCKRQDQVLKHRACRHFYEGLDKIKERNALRYPVRKEALLV